MNVPTAPYRPTAPSARDAGPYLPWLIDKAVRVGREYGHGHIVDDALTLILADLGVTKPAGGFIDSDGVTARGQRTGFDGNGFDANGYNRRGFDKDGFNADGVNAAGQTRDEVVDAMVQGWDADTAAAYARALADRVS